MARDRGFIGRPPQSRRDSQDDAPVCPPLTSDRGQLVGPFILSLLSASAATVAAGSYFAQPVAYLIGHDLGISPTLSGFIVTVGQIGYVIGLLFLMPLGDLIESRRLLVVLMTCSAGCLLGAALAPNSTIFLLACLGIGMTSIAVQILVMLASFMSSPERRGQAVGTVTSGLLVGILLAWPAATFVSAQFDWRMLYGLDALILSAFVTVLFRVLPRRVAHAQAPYATLVFSLRHLWNGTPELRHRSIRQAFLFFGFSIYWTAVPTELHGKLGLSPGEIALFGLVGGVGAFVAPIAGRAADAGRGNIASLLGLVAVAIAFLSTVLLPSVWVLCLAAIAIDAGVQANHVVSQRAILALKDGAESRLNALYIAVFFVGGAAGSALSGPLTAFGWPAVGSTGMALGTLALALMMVQAKSQYAGGMPPSPQRD